MFVITSQSFEKRRDRRFDKSATVNVKGGAHLKYLTSRRFSKLCDVMTNMFLLIHLESCRMLHLCCSCMESLFFEPEIVDSLFLRYKDLIISKLDKIENSSPPSAVVITLAHLSFFPHLRIAYNSLTTLYNVIQRDPSALTLLPSPIFPSSSPHQQYSGLSFPTALTKKLRIVFSELQTILPTDHSHLQKYTKLTNDDPLIFALSVNFCSNAVLLSTFFLLATPPIEVDSEIIRELILFVIDALPTILTNISNIDDLIASLPSDSSPTTPFVSTIGSKMVDSLKELRDKCKTFVINEWHFFVILTYTIADPHKSSIQTIILDDPSFPDLILNSLKINHKKIRLNTIMAILNIIIEFPWMRAKFMTANLVGRMFETVDFIALPLSESNTLFQLTKFITIMFKPIVSRSLTLSFNSPNSSPSCLNRLSLGV
ncbi:hypothetical protein BLNAU_14118 [Blattamonas nauphoetae]|uniref:Uncharacterized protein n=1 Tax=Blattamonas nauphoetae TaxID=2049346 RepID=A0ABQ9XHY5_9EUKA|nr:hypothetical protein BLNAU_14118 [Blattamonas nauphoetae]